LFNNCEIYHGNLKMYYITLYRIVNRGEVGAIAVFWDSFC